MPVSPGSLPLRLECPNHCVRAVFSVQLDVENNSQYYQTIGGERSDGMTEAKRPEPWLRGTLTDVPAVCRAILHALQLAEEDLAKWCGELSPQQLNARPGGVASVAFQIRHIARSIDRLLTYAEGQQLDERQMVTLKSEMGADAGSEEVFDELHAAIEEAGTRIRALALSDLERARVVGRRALPTTLGGLLVHVADHTQRHVGQAITTAKLIRGLKGSSSD